MTPALTPALALDYLRELSADVRDGMVLGAGARPLAGEPALAGPAAALVTALGDAAEGWAVLETGAAFVARGEGLAIVLACGPRALPGLTRHDLRLALGDLGAAPPPGPERPAVTLPQEAVEALLSAAQRGPGA